MAVVATNTLVAGRMLEADALDGLRPIAAPKRDWVLYRDEHQTKNK